MLRSGRGLSGEEPLQEFAKARGVFRAHGTDLNAHPLLWNGISDRSVAADLSFASDEQNRYNGTDGLWSRSGNKHSAFVQIANARDRLGGANSPTHPNPLGRRDALKSAIRARSLTQAILTETGTASRNGYRSLCRSTEGLGAAARKQARNRNKQDCPDSGRCEAAPETPGGDLEPGEEPPADHSANQT